MWTVFHHLFFQNWNIVDLWYCVQIFFKELSMFHRATQVAQWVKNPPAMQEIEEMPVRSLGLGRSSRGGHGNPLWYSCLENPMDRGARWAIVHRVAKSQTWPKRLITHTHTLPERGWEEGRMLGKQNSSWLWSPFNSEEFQGLQGRNSEGGRFELESLVAQKWVELRNW